MGSVPFSGSCGFLHYCVWETICLWEISGSGCRYSTLAAVCWHLDLERQKLRLSMLGIGTLFPCIWPAML